MNVYLKSALTIAIGALAAGADSVLSSIAPSGGFAQTLQSQPALAVVFATGVVYAHNLFTKLEAQAGLHPAQQNPPAAGTTSGK